MQLYHELGFWKCHGLGFSVVSSMIATLLKASFVGRMIADCKHSEASEGNLLTVSRKQNGKCDCAQQRLADIPATPIWTARIGNT